MAMQFLMPASNLFPQIKASFRISPDEKNWLNWKTS